MAMQDKYDRQNYRGTRSKSSIASVGSRCYSPRKKKEKQSSSTTGNTTKKKRQMSYPIRIIVVHVRSDDGVIVVITWHNVLIYIRISSICISISSIYISISSIFPYSYSYSYSYSYCINERGIITTTPYCPTTMTIKQLVFLSMFVRCQDYGGDVVMMTQQRRCKL